MSDDPLLFPCTHADDDPERATVPYIAATTAAVSGHRAIVVCTVDGVWTGVAGRSDAIEDDALPALAGLPSSPRRCRRHRL